MRLRFAYVLTLACTPLACSTSTTESASLSVGGQVSGLFGTLVLADNGSDQLSITASGSFAFGTLLSSGASYAVTIVTQPVGQVCAINGTTGTGKVGSTNVTSVQITCNAGTTALFAVGGTVSDLPAGGTLLLDNGTDSVSVTASGPFTFPKKLQAGTHYNVTVGSNPTGYACTVTGGSGTLESSPITSVSVDCAFVPVYTLGGTLTGATGSLHMISGTGSGITVASGSSFTFPGVPSGTQYTIQVDSPPAGQSCTVADGSGTVQGANITGVAVTCTALTYTISGHVTGTTGSLTVTLNGQAQNAQNVPSMGSFSFGDNLTGTTYTIDVMTPPTGQTCTVTNGTGTIAAANVTNVSIYCIPYVVSGTFATDANGMILSANDNGNTTNYQFDGNTTSFAIPGFVSGDTYDIEVLASTRGSSCTFSGSHSGTISGDVSGLLVNCRPQTYTMQGFVYFTGNATTIISDGDGISSQTINASGNGFIFTVLSDHSTVTLTTTSGNLTCTVAQGSNTFTINSANLTGIIVNCS